MPDDNDKPILDDYAGPPCYGPLSIGLGIAGLAMTIVAARTSRITGSGITVPNGLFDLAWLLAISLFVAYFWARLREESPGFDIPRFIMGIGATGALANLFLMLIMWKPPFPLLIKLCIAFLLLAVVGRVWTLVRRFLKRRRT